MGDLPRACVYDEGVYETGQSPTSLISFGTQFSDCSHGQGCLMIKKGVYEGQITTLKKKKIGENVKTLMSRMYIVHFSFNYKKMW